MFENSVRPEGKRYSYSDQVGQTCHDVRPLRATVRLVPPLSCCVHVVLAMVDGSRTVGDSHVGHRRL